jgi:hypothetical protein
MTDTWSALKEVLFIIFILLSAVGPLFTFHLTRIGMKRKHEREILSQFKKLDEQKACYEDKVEANLNKIQTWISTVIKAIMSCNGYGKSFSENYNRILEQEKKETLFELQKVKEQ